MATGKPFKTQIFDQLARLGKALASGHRLELLEFLAQGERSVEALSQVSHLSMANTSQHLQILRQAGLVETRREGQRIHYRLADGRVVALLALMRELAEDHLADIEKLITLYLSSRDTMHPIPARELLERAREGSVTVLDVRPEEEYAAGHLPGAVNIPLKDLEANLALLPAGQEVVAYCRGPWCVLAFDAVARLRARGIKARRLQDGLPEWRLAGLPVEGGSRAETNP
ncbi:transcriptional regulator, ArsR family [Magnetococcus marinus MC-1]|uniref:Transcriptional regulator, ArsR family n=1 Tax=Magnetococcus marinus (strain ATCC BAA-1437 / JCM 17883 / MC-1) TaxID=156889 RepID=A0L6M7_MAGMM|nr:metalloregulator ArsR/SmtB family transcription factor [Magnetococcus marinus]ABK43620.1 transcriptional regulator, ArsR family [Magnetococcus marinus MC-1]